MEEIILQKKCIQGHQKLELLALQKDITLDSMISKGTFIDMSQDSRIISIKDQILERWSYHILFMFSEMQPHESPIHTALRYEDFPDGDHFSLWARRYAL